MKLKSEFKFKFKLTFKIILSGADRGLKQIDNVYKNLSPCPVVTAQDVVDVVGVDSFDDPYAVPMEDVDVRIAGPERVGS